MILLASALGLSASEFADAEAYRNFLHTHFPSSTIWKATLHQENWEPPRETKILHRALRSLPTLADQMGAVWVGEDSDWLAVFPSPGADTSNPQIYCFDCQHAPKTWSPQGEGWPAFDQVQKLLVERRLKRPKVIKRVVHELVDPREIRY